MIKPTVILVLVFTILGYIFCHRYHGTRSTFRKTTGYHTFILSSGCGIGLWFLSMLLFSFISFIFTLTPLENGVFAPILLSILKISFPNLYIPLYFIHCIEITFIALYIASKGPRLALHMAAKLGDSTTEEINNAVYYGLASTDHTPEFTGILHQSIIYGLPIAFTLSNRKVYIGYPIELAPHMNDIMILPLRSGYRCEKELRLELVTDYVPVWSDIEDGNTENADRTVDLAKFLINIPVRELVHANLHDFQYKKNFEKYERPRTSEYTPQNTYTLETR
ncbi:hypothetical protein [Pseudoalteromonas sp. MMG012]|uniref:hypothetical protein n=1 Tax=Pseudoalteromonas sp. MMG012 TaxID=2822686 RepID=UPI001B3A7234|nr:hypothetical protein [Pseudoalteromonas sp. MMG012]MBQ4852701.1 hypothetical protein [Pseudoalteromonas sp. MMG012]